MASKATQASESVELTESDATVADDDGGQLPHHNFFSRLYTGTGAFEVVGRRRMWYAISGLIVAVAIASIVLRGFTFGIDFAGGTKVSFPRGDTQVTQVEDVFRQTIGVDPEAVVIVGSGASATVQIRSETLSNDQ
ncbi:MAG: protein translocase subunit SecF, partial [Mycobacterium sp.]